MVSLKFVLFVTTIITSCVMYPTAIVDGQAMTAFIATFLVFINDIQDAAATEDVEVDAAATEDVEVDVDDTVEVLIRRINQQKYLGILGNAMGEGHSILDVLRIISDYGISFESSMHLAIETWRVDVMEELMTHITDVEADDLLDFCNSSLRYSFGSGLDFFYDLLNRIHPELVAHIDKKAISAASRDGFIHGLWVLWDSENDVLREHVVYYANKYSHASFLRDINQPIYFPFCRKPNSTQIRWTSGVECPITSDVLDEPEKVACCTTCGNGFSVDGLSDMFNTGRISCPLGCENHSYCRL